VALKLLELEDEEVPAGLPGPGERRVGWTWAASLGLHVVAIVVGGGWALRSFGSHDAIDRATSREQLVAVELPAMAEGSIASLEARVDPLVAPPRISGGPAVARVDTGRDGRGGDLTVDRQALHLSDIDERMHLSQGVLNRLDRDEVPRIRSSTTRAAWEDRRSTTNPMELAFLSSGDLERLERREPAKRDPDRGVLASASPALRGGAPGVAGPAVTDRAGVTDRVPGAAHDGTRDPSPGLGVLDGVPGRDHRSAAAVAHARPDVATAPPSVEAREIARPRDDVDSEQALTARVAALVHASTAGGLAGKRGRGGELGPGDPGAQGVAGAGSHPSPLGDGVGDWFDLSSNDPRMVAYFRRFHAKVDPLWADAFPKSALLALKQGTVILEITIAGDGTARVAWPPARPSGIDEFDRKCADAVRRASPFDPIPPELGLTTLRIRAPFVATNPIVN